MRSVFDVLFPVVAERLQLPGDTFAANLTAARTACGLSIPALARQAGLDQSTVNRLEAEQRQPTLPAILSLAAALSMTGSDLLDGI